MKVAFLAGGVGTRLVEETEVKPKPMVEIGFMPEALSSKPQPYRHDWQPGNPYGNIYTGWAYPPKDYE